MGGISPAALPRPRDLVRAEERDGTIFDALAIWREVAGGGLTIVDVPGGHNEALIEPDVRALAARVAERLDERSAPAARPENRFLGAPKRVALARSPQ